MKQKLLICIGVILLSTGLLGAQDKVISGKVTDAQTREPLPGVSVFLKGTTTGTVTDINGAYQLTASEGSTIVFQAVGLLNQEVIIGTQATINIQMKEDVSELDEIVVTGYRETSKEKLAGAVSTVNAESIEQVPMATFDQILQGQAPGLLLRTESGQPGTAGRVLIRGSASLLNVLGSGEPLYILDGVAISDNVFATLNPNDIERVDVLKDAAATSIYGSRGGNGVIVITTKKGKSGKTQLNYRFQHGWTTRTRDEFDMMNTSQKIEYEKKLAEFNASQGNFTGVGRAGEIWIRTLLDPSNPNFLSQDQANGLISEFSNINTDWRDEFFRTGFHQSHEINARGGNEKTSFYASLNYFTQEGITWRSSLDRVTARLNLSQKATDRLTFGVNLTVGGSKSSFIEATGVNLNNPFVTVYLYNPYEQVRDPETGEFTVPAVGRNIIRETELNDNRRDEFKGVGSFFIEYDIPGIEGLSVKTNWGLDYLRRTETFFADPTSVFGQDPNVSVGGEGRLDKDYNEIFSYTGTTTLSYSRAFGDKHEVDVYLFNEIYSLAQTAFDYSGFGLNPKLGQSPAGITNGSEVFLPDVGGSGTESRIISYFAEANYTYDGRYTIKAGVRRDGSSKFGSNRRFATFWNVGFTWDAAQEAFLQNANFLSTLRLRASYGTVGNQLGIGDFAAIAEWDAQINYDGNQAIRPVSLADPDLTWEEVNKLNIGIDFGFLGNRISGSIDLYNEVVDRLFVETELSRTSGFTQLERNSGKLRNRGIEIALRTVNVQAGNFTWSTDVNFSYNQNEILDLGQVDQFIQGTAIVREGLPIGTHYVPDFAGVDPATGLELFRDVNGNLTTNPSNDDNRTFGTNTPPYTGGFTNTFSYGDENIGRFDLSVFFNFLAGHELISNVNWILIGPSVAQFANWNQPTYMLDFWSEPGQITDIPRPNTNNAFSSRYLERGDFVRLRNITLSYSLPNRWISRLAMRSIRVFVQGQNLWTLTEYTGLDPDINNNINQFEYPTPRIFSFGVDLGF